MHPFDTDEYKKEIDRAKKRYQAALRHNRALGFYNDLPGLWTAIERGKWTSNANKYSEKFFLSVNAMNFSFLAEGRKQGEWQLKIDVHYSGQHPEIRNGHWGDHSYSTKLSSALTIDEAREKALEFIQKKLTQLKTSRMKEADEYARQVSE